MNRTYATVFSFNLRSIELLEKLGFKKEAILRQNVFHKEGFEDQVVLGILKSEYKPIELSINE
jgi:RimJ/RimL family protein N-acetyltransferase